MNSGHNKPNYNQENLPEMVDSLNTVLDNGLLFEANLNGQIIENIELPANVNVGISHNLKMVPKYRIILRQSVGSYISDGDSDWTDRQIFLKSNIGTTVTIILMRG